MQRSPACTALARPGHESVQCIPPTVPSRACDVQEVQSSRFGFFFSLFLFDIDPFLCGFLIASRSDVFFREYPADIAFHPTVPHALLSASASGLVEIVEVQEPTCIAWGPRNSLSICNHDVFAIDDSVLRPEHWQDDDDVERFYGVGVRLL